MEEGRGQRGRSGWVAVACAGMMSSCQLAFPTVALDGGADGCVDGASCAPAENPCHLGKLACSLSLCVDTGSPNPAADGTKCGTNEVCDNGICSACQEGSPCTLAGSCYEGAFACSSGKPVCKSTATGSKLPDDAPCGTDRFCCSGACLAPDSSNCGMCGYSCLGARCLSGPTGPLRTQCEPVVVATSQPLPTGIAVDATSLYWANGGFNPVTGSVMKVALVGGAPTTLASAQDGPIGPTGLAIDSTSVYWVNNVGGTVMRVPISGGAPTTLAMAQDYPLNVAVNSTSVFWTNQMGGEVMQVGVGGGTPTALESHLSGPLGIYATDLSVYWTAGRTVVVSALGAGIPATLASNQKVPFGVVADASGTCWTDFMGGSVVTVPNVGGSPVTLARGQMSPFGIAVDASRVYWTTASDPGTVMAVARTGGNPITLASGLNEPEGVVLDATYVYWTNHGGGTVMKVPKLP